MNPAAPPQSTERRLFTSLTYKVGFLAMLVMLVVLAVFSVVFVMSERQKASATIFQNGKTFADFSARSVYAYYAQFYTHPDEADFLNFKRQVSAILDYNRDITDVSLLAPNGRILFDSKEFDEGKYSGPPRSITDQVTLDALTSSKTTTRSIKTDDRQVIEILVPLQEVGGGHIFSLRYLLSYDSLGHRMREVYRRLAVVILILSVFVAVVVVVFAGRLVRPILRLTTVAERIRRGDLSARAPESGNDEIGHLARTVNEMAAQLQGYYRSLEAKVKERTNELEMAQGELRKNIKQDEALLASIGDGAIATDRTGNIIWMNAVAAAMLKIPASDAIGRHVEEILRLETEKGEPIPSAEQPSSHALQTRAPVSNSSYYYSRRDTAGEAIVRFPAAVTVSPVILDGQAIGTINVFRDITKEKEVDRMKTEFISLASHQLRTPLSAIKWFSEMLLSGDAGEMKPEQTEFAKNIAESTERMIDLVNALLNISRIESGRLAVSPKPTDLKELVSGIVNDLKGKTEERQQTLLISVHEGLPPINIDPRLIGQVYLNLLTNAIKYSPKGGEIQVFISRKDDQIISQITDNGYGIPKEQQTRIFQKFFRAANAVKVETDGTGLGLYLIKAIVESSGGKIWFESEEGKGSTFWFSIPMSGMKAKEGEVTLDG